MQSVLTRVKINTVKCSYKTSGISKQYILRCSRHWVFMLCIIYRSLQFAEPERPSAHSVNCTRGAGTDTVIEYGRESSPCKKPPLHNRIRIIALKRYTLNPN